MKNYLNFETDIKNLENEIEKLKDFSQYLIDKKFKKVSVSPTRPYSIEKIGNKIYWHFHIVSTSQVEMHSFLSNLIKYSDEKTRISLRVDVDPVSLD